MDPQTEAHETLDPTDWTSFRAQAHLMLDDMLGYIENIRERPVWQPIPDAVRARFRSPAPRLGEDLAQVHARVHARGAALRSGQRTSGLHGLGERRRHAGRHGGGDARCRAERQSRRPRSYSDRGRAAGYALGGRAVWISGRGVWIICHRNVDGESDRCSHCARCGPGHGSARRRSSGGIEAPDGLHFHIGS